MIWARKVVFSTTDLIFPGFKDATLGKTDQRQYRAVKVRSSWYLQAILTADALFFAMWVLAFLATFDISLSVLKELHGNLVVSMSAMFILVNIPRLLFGLKGNQRDKLELLSLFWMTTLIVSVPLLGFILFSDIFTPVLRVFTAAMDSVMMILILLEFLLATFHLKDLIKDELRIMRLAKLTEQSQSPTSPLGGESSRTEDEQNIERLKFPVPFGMPPMDEKDEEKLPQEDGDEDDKNQFDDSDGNDGWSSDDDDDNRAMQQRHDHFRRKYLHSDTKLDYQVNIRRLTPEPEEDFNYTADEEEEEEEEEEGKDDGSDVVTSTSDAVRQRSTRVS